MSTANMSELMLYGEQERFIQKKWLLDRSRYFHTTPSLHNRRYWAKQNIISEVPAHGAQKKKNLLHSVTPVMQATLDFPRVGPIFRYRQSSVPWKVLNCGDCKCSSGFFTSYYKNPCRFGSFPTVYRHTRLECTTNCRERDFLGNCKFSVILNKICYCYASRYTKNSAQTRCWSVN